MGRAKGCVSAVDQRDATLGQNKKASWKGGRQAGAVGDVVNSKFKGSGIMMLVLFVWGKSSVCCQGVFFS